MLPCCAEMSTSRILGDGQCYYHVLSRVIERRFIFDEQGQEYFKKVMRAQEAFSGVRVLTWTCMSNHFHMLVAVEDRESEEVKQELAQLMADDEAFLARLKHIYAPTVLDDVRARLELLRGGDGGDGGMDGDLNPSFSAGQEPFDQEGEAGAFVELDAEEIAQSEAKEIVRFKQPYLDRMFDLSSFVGEIKQRISQWHNGCNERLGPLWEDRFKSVLVQGEPGVLATVAAYIDLNAVRAGVVKDPREWRWCGYAEAVAAQCRSRDGVYEALGQSNAERRDGAAWRNVHARYRRLLMEEGVEQRDDDGRVVRKGISREELEAEEARGFELPAPALLHHRIRYLVDGLALGSAAFVEAVFAKNRAKLGVKRTSGARVPKSVALGGLRTLRDLRAT
jgi:putative transposase